MRNSSCGNPHFPKLSPGNDGPWPNPGPAAPGVATVDEQIKLFKNFKQAGVKVLSYQVDSFTRNNNYAGAEEAIRDSRLSKNFNDQWFPGR